MRALRQRGQEVIKPCGLPDQLKQKALKTVERDVDAMLGDKHDKVEIEGEVVLEEVEAGKNNERP